ncbi:MAG: hypothetical protein LBU04_04610 [Christensenellaceae bacterium]|jgi:hypothetical protein|nr:hypothetical protein [Christensenellaceae bacterium]
MSTQTFAQEAILEKAKEKEDGIVFQDHLEDGDYSDSPDHMEHTDS